MMNDAIDLLLFIVGVYANSTISELMPEICFPVRFSIVLTLYLIIMLIKHILIQRNNN